MASSMAAETRGSLMLESPNRYARGAKLQLAPVGCLGKRKVAAPPASPQDLRSSNRVIENASSRSFRHYELADDKKRHGSTVSHRRLVRVNT
jgi:hypothetical protein